jgi:CubicO group peptidase (beta-lactamase class C family)
MKLRCYSLFRLVLLFVFLLSACSNLAPAPIATLVPTSVSTPPAVPQPTPSPTAMPYWPARDWRTSTPEQQGMDSELLAQMMEQIQSKQINLHSLIIVRHGYIVTETYFQPYEADNQVEIYSITKSIVSALVGIAIQQGSIDSVNHKVLDYFPDLEVANNDARKQAITLEHLLTMSSGLEWSDDVNNGEMDQSQDTVKYVLDRPMAATPGQVFVYNSGAPTILTAILRKTTGKSPLEFAQANLLGPLGISDIRWKTYQNGLEVGGAGIQLTPRDMAKLGYLYLRGGLWEGKQIVPATAISGGCKLTARSPPRDWAVNTFSCCRLRISRWYSPLVSVPGNSKYRTICSRAIFSRRSNQILHSRLTPRALRGWNRLSKPRRIRNHNLFRRRRPSPA